MRRTPLFALSAAALVACHGADLAPPRACAPDCTARQCGDDGCGGSCGACGAGQSCGETFQCVASCTPSCEGRVCGDDGCGGSCGACPEGAACGLAGACEATPSPACGGGGLHCLLENHVANEYACARLAGGGWSCERTGVVLGTYGYTQVCRIGCAGGNSSCGHTDVDYVVECQVCEAGCVEPESVEACPGETPERCPFPCACR